MAKQYVRPTGKWSIQGADDGGESINELLLLLVAADGRITGAVDDGDGVFDGSDSDSRIHGAINFATGNLHFRQTYSDGVVTTWAARYNRNDDSITEGRWGGEAAGSFSGRRAGGLDSSGPAVARRENAVWSTSPSAPVQHDQHPKPPQPRVKPPGVVRGESPMRRLLSDSEGSTEDEEETQHTQPPQPQPQPPPPPPPPQQQQQQHASAAPPVIEDVWAGMCGASGPNAADPPVEVRVHIHAARQLTAKDGSTSDPYVLGHCHGETRRTRVAQSGTDACWEEELQFFNVHAITRSQLAGEMLTLEVWDADTTSRDDMIGAFTFDIDRLQELEGKMYHKAWVTLYNAADDQIKGPQGQLQVSVTVLGPGDELPQRPSAATANEEEGDGERRIDTMFHCLNCLSADLLLFVFETVAEYALNVELYRAEGIPRMDEGIFENTALSSLLPSFTTEGSAADPYVSLAW